MTMQQLIYALTVSRCGSFLKASDKLFVSQPALSQQIRNLENELGYEIFERSPQGVHLTQGGEEFCALAQKVESSWEEFLHDLSETSQHFGRKLVISTGTRVFSNGLFERLAGFIDRHSEWEVSFVAEAGKDYISALKNGEIDVALDRLPPVLKLEESEGLSFFPLIREQQCVLMSKDDPGSELESISLEELRDCSVLTGLENSIEDRTLRALCRENDLSFKRIYRSDSLDAHIRLARVGKGILFGPRSFADFFDLAAVPLKPETEQDMMFICLERNSHRRDIELLREFLQNTCKSEIM